MDKFLNLTIEKQNSIIDAALKAFGKNGYKKTSASDIAAAAGISKAMIFHYFGTKKALYLYLINLSGSLIMKEIDDKFDYGVTDFFERIKISSSIKIAVLKQHPPMMSFLTGVYFEEDEEVKGDIKKIIVGSEGFKNKIIKEDIDYSKFKEDVDIKLLVKMIYWLADGYAKQFSEQGEIDYESLYNEFSDCLNLLKNNLYKEKYK
ncbi:TetR family transcriptional regulator [Clostridium sp. 19966]|uniref:TetR/AcrR family transcriptional regulator n=1 Tax=Clostridium sp. 19966 TaxID=2768166 RepID=UPI0028DE28DF|nr:TetR/AcrR family transcriptional regulator [Clostridium sp. 19966]MDT8719357.1 TetR family transcriptional regulator [Clostridium sp. 19966]